MPEQRPVSRPVPRIDALRLISQRFPDDPVVFTCGATSREIASLERRENHLCVVDSMGLVSSITLGLGLGLEEFPERRVVGVEGDGGMLANLNSLATIGYLQPGNLLLIVLDNESYGSTGGQATFTTRLDLADIAAGMRVQHLEARWPGVPGPSDLRSRRNPGARIHPDENRLRQRRCTSPFGRPCSLG